MTEELFPNEIYLLVGEGDEGSTIWCDHIPDDDMNTVKYTRARPKYKRVDLDEFILTGSNDYCDGNNKAIRLIKSKYGDLYILTKEGE